MIIKAAKSRFNHCPRPFMKVFQKLATTIPRFRSPSVAMTTPEDEKCRLASSPFSIKKRAPFSWDFNNSRIYSHDSVCLSNNVTKPWYSTDISKCWSCWMRDIIDTMYITISRGSPWQAPPLTKSHIPREYLAFRLPICVLKHTRQCRAHSMYIM